MHEGGIKVNNVNLLNRAALESALEALGCVHDTENIVEKMQDYVIYYTREAERFLVEILTPYPSEHFQIPRFFLLFHHLHPLKC